MKLTHPESSQTIDVRPEYVEAYKSQGWTEAGKKAEKPEGK